MSIRESLIKTYLQDEEVYEIIWHDIIVYLKLIWGYLLLLFATGLLWYLLVSQFGNNITIKRIMSGLWVIIYIKWTVDILDRYLDALLVTNIGLLLFKRDGLFSQKVTNMQWVSTETIQYEQNSFWDSLFKKWDIRITVEDATYVFNEASRPAEKVTQILLRKDKVLWRNHYTENAVEPSETISQDKYEILVEALWEVVTEYVQKKNDELPYK